jgi:hypothetical protein
MQMGSEAKGGRENIQKKDNSPAGTAVYGKTMDLVTGEEGMGLGALW